VSLLQELLRRQVERRDTEAALQQRELEGARAETAAATQRLTQLREAVGAEAAATALVLDKAEAAARLLGEQLLSLQAHAEEEAAAAAAAAVSGGDEEQVRQSGGAGACR
jgi:hypothetical protein